MEGTTHLLFDKVEIAFIGPFVAYFYWLKPLRNEGGEQTGVPRENPVEKLQKMF